MAYYHNGHWTDKRKNSKDNDRSVTGCRNKGGQFVKLIVIKLLSE